MQSRLIDGVEYCISQEFTSQILYTECPPPPADEAAAVLGLGTVAILAVLAVAWVAPEIARRRTQYQTVILNAQRSL